MATWGEFTAAAPGLATFGAARLNEQTAFLATVRGDGWPRVHPVTPIIGDGRLFLFMEPTSPKRKDLIERRHFAIHNGVGDNSGTGGEFFIAGDAVLTDDPNDRALATASSSYPPADRYVLFELFVTEARAIGYGDVELPEPARWRE